MAEIEEREVFFPNPRSHYSKSHFCNKNNISLQQCPFSKIFTYVPSYQDISLERRETGRKKKKEGG